MMNSCRKNIVHLSIFVRIVKCLSTAHTGRGVAACMYFYFNFEMACAQKRDVKNVSLLLGILQVSWKVLIKRNVRPLKLAYLSLRAVH